MSVYEPLSRSELLNQVESENPNVNMESRRVKLLMFEELLDIKFSFWENKQRASLNNEDLDLFIQGLMSELDYRSELDEVLHYD